uniref:Uncharacterized protein n=1 Tax=Anguilla anguilla TaxID=7936 RepID=A0A0E9QTN0_ANGAN
MYSFFNVFNGCICLFNSIDPLFSSYRTVFFAHVRSHFNAWFFLLLSRDRQQIFSDLPVKRNDDCACANFIEMVLCVWFDCCNNLVISVILP